MIQFCCYLLNLKHFSNSRDFLFCSIWVFPFIYFEHFRKFLFNVEILQHLLLFNCIKQFYSVSHYYQYKSIQKSLKCRQEKLFRQTGLRELNCFRLRAIYYCAFPSVWVRSQKYSFFSFPPLSLLRHSPCLCPLTRIHSVAFPFSEANNYT